MQEQQKAPGNLGVLKQVNKNIVTAIGNFFLSSGAVHDGAASVSSTGVG